MKIKKLNAVLSLLVCLGLVAHVCYNAVSYIFFFYNPFFNGMFGGIVSLFVIFHIIFSVYNVFIAHDSVKISYANLNKRTLWQRITAVAITCLLPIHMFNAKIVLNPISDLVFWLLQALQVLFYAAVFYHAAISVSNALVTLGFMGDIRKKRRFDTIMFITGTVLFIAMSILVLSTYVKLHAGAGGAA